MLHTLSFFLFLYQIGDYFMSNDEGVWWVFIFIGMMPILTIIGFIIHNVGWRDGEAYGRQDQEIKTIKYCITKPKVCKLKYDFYNLK